MKFRNIFLPFVISLFLFGCSGQGGNSVDLAIPASPGMGGSILRESAPPALKSNSRTEESLDYAYDGDDFVTQDQNEVEVLETKLIKTGNISFETNDIHETEASVLEIAERYQAYVSNTNEYRDSINLTLRIPAENFDMVVNEILDGLKFVDSKNINVQDVSEEFYDLTARLKTKQELEARYFDILGQAESVEDILSVERELSAVRSDIESMEGRLKYLNDQISMSTLSLYIRHTTVNKVFWGSEFSFALKNGLQNIIWFFVGIVNIWPFVILIAVAVWLFFRRRRLRVRMKDSKPKVKTTKK